MPHKTINLFGEHSDRAGLRWNSWRRLGRTAGYGKTGITSGKQEYLENVLNGYLLGL